MDIQQAKQQIKYTMQAYFAKDEFGGYARSASAPSSCWARPASAKPPSSSRSHKSLRWASFPTP